MPTEIWITAVVRDKDGKVTRRLRRKSRSYVRQMIDWLRAQMGRVNTASVLTTGAAGTIAAGEPIEVDAGAGGAHGIRVGTGTNPVTINDYNLQTPIAHGVGAGQLSYGAVTVSAPATVGSSRQITVTRTLTNNSGAAITINEVALIGEESAGLYYMIERSLLTLTIANGGSSTITYTIKVTV